MERRDPMVDIHIRISRKLLLGLVIVFVLIPVVWLLLQTAGGSSSGGVQMGPVTTEPTP